MKCKNKARAKECKREGESVCVKLRENGKRERQAEETEREPVLKEFCVSVCVRMYLKLYANKMRMWG